MKTLLLLAAFVATVLPAFAAGPEPKADGSFTSRNFTMPVSTGMAFRGKSAIDKQDVIVVALSNGDFRTDWFAGFTDRRRAIERRMKDKDTAVVYFEFKPDGSYRGLSYYFTKGNGCGYCGGSLGVTSTVKLAGGRVAGKGFSKGSQAVLLIEGESSVIKLTGEVVLINEGGTWRVDDELTDVIMQ